jgi:hypothetical protein
MVHGSVGDHEPKLLLHPRALRRTNWYAFNGDQYGTQEVSYAAVKRAGVTDVTASNNEVVIQCVEPTDYVGVVVRTVEQKNVLIKQLESAGYAGGFNGQPWDSFILTTHDVQNLHHLRSKLPLAKAAI